MAPPVEAKKKFFSVEDANRTLPLVRAIVTDIVEQFVVVNDLRQRLSSLSTRNRRRRTDDPYAEEVAQHEAELEAEEAKLSAFMEELNKLGVELKGHDGLCDFPSLRDGREVCLCWRLGEPEVLYWHEVHAGFSGRQPLRPAPAPRRF
jgi:hypothetical protein